MMLDSWTFLLKYAIFLLKSHAFLNFEILMVKDWKSMDDYFEVSGENLVHSHNSVRSVQEVIKDLGSYQILHLNKEYY